MLLTPDAIPSGPVAEIHTCHFIAYVASFKVNTPLVSSIDATELISLSLGDFSILK